MKKYSPVVLVILDGLADNPNTEGNAVAAANTPTLDMLRANWPSCELTTHGERVGLPDGQMGNSEVGHLNIGGGRVVEQELTRINRSVREGTIGESDAFCSLAKAVADLDNRALHFVGLVSRGGVHSNVEHLQALIEAAIKKGVSTIFIHAIADGRDRPPQASTEEIGAFADFVASTQASAPQGTTIHISSLIGRYFIMDRDKRWERTQAGYDLITAAKGESFPDVMAAINARHAAGETDEFISAATIPLADDSLGRSACIEDGDAVVFFNFRADRMRQIVPALIGQSVSKDGDVSPFTEFTREVAPSLAGVATLTEYDPNYDVQVLFKPFHVVNHLGEVVAQAGLTQLRIAETEKYAHVTYFFNGGVETESKNERRSLVPSPRDVATYDLKPEMSAFGVKDLLCEQLRGGDINFAVVNFANCDMVGHTGSLEAATKAVEAVDTCLGEVVSTVESLGGALVITADHGNADQMVDYTTHTPHTFHTTHPVPLFIVGDGLQGTALRDGGALCDIAPTVCELLGISPAKEMTGGSLLSK